MEGATHEMMGAGFGSTSNSPYSRQQTDNFGLNQLTGKKDPFKKFYNRASDDYIFKIDNLPEAFEKLEQEEPESEQKRKQQEVLDKTKDNKQLLLEQFVDPNYLNPEMETGYFSELASSFKASSDDIKKNYVKKMQLILNGREQLSLKKDKFLLKELKKLINSYKVLENEDDRQEYLNMLRLRSFASQHNSVVSMLKDGNFFPFLIFIVSEGNE